LKLNDIGLNSIDHEQHEEVSQEVKDYINRMHIKQLKIQDRRMSDIETKFNEKIIIIYQKLAKLEAMKELHHEY